MVEAGTTDISAARLAYAEHRWAEALEGFAAADAAEGLDRADLDRYGQAAWWVGQLATAIAARERAFAAHLAAGDRQAAAAAALAVAGDHGHRLQHALAGGWVRRAAKLLDGETESAAHGYLGRARVNAALAVGDLEAALAEADAVLALGVRIGDRDLEALGLQDKGRVLVARGDVAEGLALLDEAVVAAVGGELNPYATAIVYCNSTVACQDLADYRRAVEFADAAKQWCERQAISGFPGMCRVRRAEVTRLRGAWAEAEAEARQACVELQDFSLDYAGEGFYQVGEIRLRMGDLTAASEAFRQAHALGRNPLPGLALLRLAEGKGAAGLALLGRALADPTSPPLSRARWLAAYTEIAVEIRDTEGLEGHVDELDEIATRYGTHALLASAAMARGQLALARDDVPLAGQHLERARRLWQESDAPYETARAREALGLAHERAGDADAATFELRAAAEAYRRLGADPDARRSDARLRSAATGDAAETVRRTMMFTDIVRSTQLIEAIGDSAWTGLLGWHDRTIRALIAAHDGEEIHHAGDGFFVAFGGARQALDCAIAVQRSLADHRRANGFAPSVRIGLHVGDVVQPGPSYEGRAVHLAARIGAMAAPDEILASLDVLEAVGTGYSHSEPRAVELRGLREPVQVATVSVASEWSPAPET